MLRIPLIIAILIPVVVFAQNSPKKAAKKLGPNPLIIVDSVRITREEMQAIDAKTITSVHVFYDTTATKLYGDSAKDGAVICETRAFARKHYIAFFRKVSAKYDSLYSMTKTDTVFQYIINDKIKTGNFEGDLDAINDDLFISMEILTADDLRNKYNVTDKIYGILINCRRPKNLYHAKKKF